MSDYEDRKKLEGLGYQTWQIVNLMRLKKDRAFKEAKENNNRLEFIKWLYLKGKISEY